MVLLISWSTWSMYQSERQVSEGGEANAVQEVKDGSHPGDPTDENATLGAKN
jgi:hypothetical protein